MKIEEFLQEPIDSLLDVGCNVGGWLHKCALRYPAAKLAGVEINAQSLETARRRVPNCDFRHAIAEELPFADQSFQYVTCMEVLEHLPADSRPTAFREMHRVLRPGGRLILTVPHAGWFAWLDANNIRLRLPTVYRRLFGKGLRDDNYHSAGRKLEWHQHFRLEELQALAGEGWRQAGVAYGGLFVFPLVDWLCWPFYRLGCSEHPLRRGLERMASWDYRCSYGRASYGILMALDRTN